MHGCHIDTELEGGRTVIRVAGVFDPASAFELSERLDREPAGELVLDFSLVREFADLAIATLAHGIAGLDRRLRLRGLRRDQLHIFRHFGVDAHALQGALREPRA